MKDLGEMLEGGQGAIVMIGESRVEEQLEKALTHAIKSVEKELDADSKELKRELEEAEKEEAGEQLGPARASSPRTWSPGTRRCPRARPRGRGPTA